jgi:heptosyltransferase-2
VRQFGFFPYRSPATVLELALSCRPCSAQGGEVCPLGHHKCLREISPQMVMEAVRELGTAEEPRA